MNKITVENNIAIIHFKNGEIGIFDKEDIDKIKDINWRVSSRGYVFNNSVVGDVKHFHRMVLDTRIKDSQCVDHKNGVKTDNRKVNLRIVTKSQNAMNSKSLGISQTKNGKWQVRIMKEGKSYNFGTIAKKDCALFVRRLAEHWLFREYAKKDKKIHKLSTKESIKWTKYFNNKKSQFSVG